jgi:hypothetical protein
MEPKAKRTVNPLATLAELYPDVRVAAYARRPYQTGWRVTLDAEIAGAAVHVEAEGDSLYQAAPACREGLCRGQRLNVWKQSMEATPAD